MRKAEFLKELQEALAGEVSSAVIRENLNYYDQYISQETASGRGEEEVLEELGSPRLIARTIIDSSEAAGDSPEPESGYGSSGDSYGDGGRSGGVRGGMDFHYIDLSKWYWKLLVFGVIILVMVVAFTVIGGIFSLLMRFAGPLILIWLVYTFIKSMRR